MLGVRDKNTCVDLNDLGYYEDLIDVSERQRVLSLYILVKDSSSS